MIADCNASFYVLLAFRTSQSYIDVFFGTNRSYIGTSTVNYHGNSMKSLRKLSVILMIGITFFLLCIGSALADQHEEAAIDVNDPNYNPDPTLFKGAANNPFFPLFFNALPEGGAENVPTEGRRKIGRAHV